MRSAVETSRLKRFIVSPRVPAVVGGGGVVLAKVGVGGRVGGDNDFSSSHSPFRVRRLSSRISAIQDRGAPPPRQRQREPKACI